MPQLSRAEDAESSVIGASACKMCHPGEHASFQKTFHRSMTRPVSALRFDGDDAPRLPTKLELFEVSFDLRQQGDRVLVQGPDLHVLAALLRRLRRLAKDERESEAQLWTRARDAFSQVRRVEREIVLVTGSHNYLAFWVEGGEGRELRQLPFVYRLSEKSWASRRDMFLQPPQSTPHLARWNANCIQCHTVAGQPGQSEGREVQSGKLWTRYDSEVGELGISCEACHGPGRAHADSQRNPLQRLSARNSAQPKDLEIANPKRLDAARASAICGQCHAYYLPTNPDDWWDHGFVGEFFPGQGPEVLAASREVLTPDPEQLTSLSQGVQSIFWGDGTIRVGGREYNGLLTSPCYERGQGERQMGCGSCHSLHQGTQSDQLSVLAAENPNQPCQSCHSETPEHSGHPDGSLGRSCVNCHMPRTTYALLKSIRSHRISSPSERLSDPPSACVLCHVDRSPRWLSGRGSDSAPDQSVPEGVTQALSGNAAVRAIFADNLGSKETRTTIGDDLARTLLEQLSTDPYAAVRTIAKRELREVEGSARVEGAVSSAWRPTVRQLEDLRAAQDQTPIVISE